MEGVACKTTIIHYFIICFNARFGWIPFSHKFSSLAGVEEKSADEQYQNLDYEAMTSALCGIKFKLDFRFSDSTCRVLANALSNLQNEKDPYKRMSLKLGESLNNVSFECLKDLVIISNG